MGWIGLNFDGVDYIALIGIWIYINQSQHLPRESVPERALRLHRINIGSYWIQILDLNQNGNLRFELSEINFFQGSQLFASRDAVSQSTECTFSSP